MSIANPIDTMPRGGADAVKQRVITGLDAVGTRTGQHEQHARLALQVVADKENPRILEIGAGHGKLSPAAFTELGKAADPDMNIAFWPVESRGPVPTPIAVVYSRAERR